MNKSSMDLEREALKRQMNLNTLRRFDAQVVAIVDSAPHIQLHSYTSAHGSQGVKAAWVCPFDNVN